MDLEDKIKEMKETVLNSPTGHLPLCYRVELLQKLGNARIVNKVFFECVKKVYIFWKQEFSNDSILCNLLNLIDQYLYHSKGETIEFQELADKYRSYIEEAGGRAELAGLSEISLCYSIANDAAAILDIDDYKGEDDEYFEYDVWNPDFFAAMAFSGGNPFIGEGDVQKRTDYWIWYLDIILKLHFYPESPILQCPPFSKEESSLSLIPKRTQTYHISSILSKIQEVIDKALELYSRDYNDKWDNIVILACCMFTGLNVDNYAIRKGQKYPMKVSLKSFDTMNEVKKEMYNQSKIEGAWFLCKIIINANLNYTLEFDYDDKTQIPKDQYIDPEDFKREFKQYPRGKDYTPIWWQNILGERAKYIK